MNERTTLEGMNMCKRMKMWDESQIASYLMHTLCDRKKALIPMEAVVAICEKREKQAQIAHI